MSALAEILVELRDVLRSHPMRWYVFGAQAVAVRGAPRATQDVDVTVLGGRDQVHTVVQALLERGFAHRFPEQADQLMRLGAVIPLQHRNGMELDLVLGGSGLETLAEQRATTAALAGVEVPVASATDLVVMKVLAARGKDLDDVAALIAGGEVDLHEARGLLLQLEQALGVSDLVRVLDD